FDRLRDELAQVLNTDIVDINFRIKGKRKKKMNKQYIVVICAPLNSIPETVFLDEKYLQTDRNIITLGVNWLGAVTADLRKTPHMLIGGSSGCGKTVLCRSLIYQFVKHKDTVYIADFKGIDFFEEQEAGYTVVTEEADFKNLIESILKELDTRKALFRKAHVRNLSQYNKKNPDNQLPRIVLFVDEAAEILDTTGLPKEQKAEIAEITSLLSRGARKYRALGLTLCICTQRPSNDIISGQIKNNLDLRIAGKCDSVLSDIILDTTEAARQIPKDSVGLFFSNTAGLFRGFLLDEDEAEE
ncbi:MAG: AAA family ATPase, partial [Clostridia bacterium]|nr:AAA family ATPase [Clostridia bacterium]